jgi:hypothetical protein
VEPAARVLEANPEGPRPRAETEGWQEAEKRHQGELVVSRGKKPLRR